MCNAWNHPPDCSCGWGGVWYGSANGGDNWLFNKEKQPRTLGYQRDTSEIFATSLTNPNARCPVCNALVFFYKSSYGGRVFFDELGPPWPKHECTNQNTPSSRSCHSRLNNNEWQPLSAVYINNNQNTKEIHSINGQLDERKFQFYFRSNDIVVADIVKFRKTTEHGVFLISILYYDPKTKNWNVVSITAFADEQKAERECFFAEFITIAKNSDKTPLPLDEY